MKHLTTLFTAGLAAAMLFPLADARAEGHLDRIRRDGEVRVCIWPDYYSISYRNTRTGELEGIDIDMARNLAGDLGVNVHFVDSSFKTMIDDLLGNKCDISMHAVAVTPARQEKLVFSPPHLRSGVFAITTKSHPTIKDWGDIDRNGVVVAAAAGTYMVDVMKAELKQARLLVVENPEAREQEVMSGRADLFVTDYPFSRKMLARHDWAKLLAPPTPLAPSPYAYAMAPGDAPWLEAVNAFVMRTKSDGRLLAAAKANGLDAIVDLK